MGPHFYAVYIVYQLAPPPFLCSVVLVCVLFNTPHDEFADIPSHTAVCHCPWAQLPLLGHHWKMEPRGFLRPSFCRSLYRGPTPVMIEFSIIFLTPLPPQLNYSSASPSPISHLISFHFISLPFALRVLLINVLPQQCTLTPPQVSCVPEH